MGTFGFNSPNTLKIISLILIAVEAVAPSEVSGLEKGHFSTHKGSLWL